MEDQLIREKLAAKEAELQQTVANYNAGEQQRQQIVNALQQLRSQATHLEGQVVVLRELLGEEPNPDEALVLPEELPEEAPVEETPVE